MLILTIAVIVGIALSYSSVTSIPSQPHQEQIPIQHDPAEKSPLRIVAVGDLHGDLEASMRVLKMAKICDHTGKWIAEPGTVFVSTGDIVDRGPDTLALYYLMRNLTEQAKANGGLVKVSLGNHETMNMMNDLRYVHPGDTESFGGPEKRKEAWSKDGFPGGYLRTLNIINHVNSTVFVHGGIHPEWAAYGIDAMNKEAKHALDNLSPEDLRYVPIFNSASGPLWYRGYALDAESQVCPLLTKALDYLGMDRMVMGHTVQDDGRIGTRCGGRIVLIDVGISKAYGRHCAALEIVGDSLKALYPEGAVPL
ncbi:Metallo-dependent phosphatase-like protein [Cladochytrium replicatum]|nr:Metallo-dependent phosphatase-like protein [Cladochytrium replicatum]